MRGRRATATGSFPRWWAPHARGCDANSASIPSAFCEHSGDRRSDAIHRMWGSIVRLHVLPFKMIRMLIYRQCLKTSFINSVDFW